jgi:hypothetical protein
VLYPLHTKAVIHHRRSFTELGRRGNRHHVDIFCVVRLIGSSHLTCNLILRYLDPRAYHHAQAAGGLLADSPRGTDAVAALVYDRAQDRF